MNEKLSWMKIDSAAPLTAEESGEARRKSLAVAMKRSQLSATLLHSHRLLDTPGNHDVWMDYCSGQLRALPDAELNAIRAECYSNMARYYASAHNLTKAWLLVEEAQLCANLSMNTEIQQQVSETLEYIEQLLDSELDEQTMDWERSQRQFDGRAQS